MKHLGACQDFILCDKPNVLASGSRFFVTNRLKDTLGQVIAAVAKHWTVETQFADFKELMGSDQYQLQSSLDIERFWALALWMYQFLDGLRHRLERLQNRHISLGETRAWLIDHHITHQLDWICYQGQGCRINAEAM